MSHFLSRLVQRTRGEVATVRPTRHAVTAPDPTAAAWDEQVTVREAAPLASTAQAAYTAPWAPSPGMAPLGDPSDERVPIGDAAPASWTAAVEPSMRLASARRSAEATDDQVAMREISSSAVGARMVGPTLASAAPRAGTQISTQIGAQIDAQIGSQIEAQVDREAVPAEAGQAGPFARSATAEAPLRSTAAALVAPAERAPEIRLRRVVALTPASDPRIAPRDPVGNAVASGRIVATPLAAGDAPVTGPLAAAPPGAGFATALVGTRIHERSGDGAQSPGEQSTVIARPMLDQPVRRTGQLTAPLALARADGPAPDPAGRGGAARRASESPDSSLHEAATTVEVSIGRIEVRLPPRPRGSGRDPVSPKRPPVVGLAEYLRARQRKAIMSNVNAVAVATEGLKALVQRAFDEAGTTAVSGARVSAVRPGAIPTDFRGVNLFLYLVTPNAALRNDDLPTRRASGELVRRPQLAIDLHYLLTFVGDEAALEPQRIFGAAAAGLHAHPELTPEDIDEIAQTAPADSYLRLHNDLAQQIERVRFNFAVLSIEELSKLWMTFPQKQYDLSAALCASVVLLEAPLTPAVRRPVARRGIYTGLPRPPLLTAITPQLTPRNVAGQRARLTLDGAGLAGEATRVRLGTLDPVAPVRADDARVVVEIPDGLRAGIHAVQVLVAHTFSGTEPRRFELASDTQLFVLEPRITTPPPIATSVEGVITLDVEPAIAARQQVKVIVGDHVIPWIPPRPGPGVADEHPAFTVTLPPEVGAGRHPLRVEVDGAVSELVDPPDPVPPGAVPSPFVEVT